MLGKYFWDVINVKSTEIRKISHRIILCDNYTSFVGEMIWNKSLFDYTLRHYFQQWIQPGWCEKKHRNSFQHKNVFCLFKCAIIITRDLKNDLVSVASFENCILLVLARRSERGKNGFSWMKYLSWKTFHKSFNWNFGKRVYTRRLKSTFYMIGQMCIVQSRP